MTVPWNLTLVYASLSISIIFMWLSLESTFGLLIENLVESNQESAGEVEELSWFQYQLNGNTLIPNVMH